ncbi:MAG TPA: metallophosphoesterase, partial [Nitrososphaeraceae archaeon]|nr:metallophosphoesterase [Nitrososphaeraceae archaeon]
MICTILHFTSISAANNEDGFFTVNPEDYYNTEDSEEESQVSNQLSDEKNNAADKNALQKLSTQSTTTTTTTNTIDRHPFNIAVTADWGCEEDTKKTVENIQKKNPELVISAGDASYHKSSECWFDIIKPLKSKMKIAMGDHEYSDTSGGVTGVINQYLKPLNLQKTYYSFDINNAHVTVMDAYIDYEPGSDQYQFIENDLKTTFTDPSIGWRFVVESAPIYTSPSQHPGDSKIRDIYHPLFDKYGVDIVFTSDNHNYQRTFPIKYNSGGGDSSNPIISDSNQDTYHTINADDINNNNNKGIIYVI